jgi:uncharacterized protein YcbK (DUF882 family)
MKLSKNFTKEELECKCGCGFLPTKEAIEKLQNIRTKIGKPLIISSGARCASHNTAIKGSKNSQHIHGIAFDIKCPPGQLRMEVITAAIEEGFKGIGWAKTFLHIDLRSSPMCWEYN